MALLLLLLLLLSLIAASQTFDEIRQLGIPGMLRVSICRLWLRIQEASSLACLVYFLSFFCFQRLTLYPTQSFSVVCLLETLIGLSFEPFSAPRFLSLTLFFLLSLCHCHLIILHLLFLLISILALLLFFYLTLQIMHVKVLQTDSHLFGPAQPLLLLFLSSLWQRLLELRRLHRVHELGWLCIAVSILAQSVEFLSSGALVKPV